MPMIRWLSLDHTKKDSLPHYDLENAVRQAWQDQLLFDFTIQVEDREFKVHKLIMASASDYFKAMLTGGMVESQNNHVTLEGLNALAVSNIIEYIYTSKITGTRASASNLLMCGTYLQIPAIVRIAVKFLRDETNHENCFDVLEIFQDESYGFKNWSDTYETREYIKDNVSEILEKHTLDRIPLKHVRVILDDWIQSDWDLFMTIKDWLEVDFEKRREHIDNLMEGYVRFHLLSMPEIEVIRNMDIYAIGKWHENLEKVVREYHEGPVVKRANESFDYGGDVRNDKSVLVSYATDTEENTMYELTGKDWGDKIPIPSTPCLSGGIAAYTVIYRNFLFVCGHYSNGAQPWFMFDPRTLKWSPMPSLNTLRRDFVLTNNQESLYVMGGRVGTSTEIVTDSIENFSFETGIWTTLDLKLPLPLQGLTGCEFLGHIYITGGWQTLNRLGDCMNQLYFLDREKPDRFEVKAPMPLALPCHYMHNMWFDNKEVLLVMNEDFVLQYYNPSTNQWTVWKCMQEDMISSLVWHESGIIVSGFDVNSLYLLNFATRPDIDYDDDSDEDEPDLKVGICMKWEFDIESKYITEIKLKDFPITWDADLGQNFIACMLAIPKPSMKNPVNKEMAQNENTLAAANCPERRLYNLRSSRL